MTIALIIRWAARCLSAALVGLFIVFFVGEGPPPLFEFSRDALMSWLLLLTVLGFMAAWRYEFWGGIIGLAAIADFYLTDYVAGDFRHWPRGWLFPGLMIVPLLFLLAWWLRRSHKS
jgi:hypothetical protein